MHIDLSLHAATLTRLTQEGQAQVERSAVVDGCGLLNLYDSWLRIIAEAVVQQNRDVAANCIRRRQILDSIIIKVSDDQILR